MDPAVGGESDQPSSKSPTITAVSPGNGKNYGQKQKYFGGSGGRGRFYYPQPVTFPVKQRCDSVGKIFFFLINLREG